MASEPLTYPGPVDGVMRGPWTGDGWTADDVPDQSGRTVVVTGANSGIGFEATAALAAKGAHVVMACRSTERADRARAEIEARPPDASLSTMELDLGSLDSIRAFASGFEAAHDRLDVLVNNAGVMMIPPATTADGFERQVGVNHLGHFALTGRLLPRLLDTPGEPRVVTQSSGVHRQGEVDVDDLGSGRSSGRVEDYARSKLANLLFAYELDRRLRATGGDAISVACHPGWAATGLQTGDTELGVSAVRRALARVGNALFAQSAAAGALPALYAATAPNVDGGHYFGPAGVLELRGPPTRVVSSDRSYDHETARRLWEASADLTGVEVDLEAPPTA